MAFNPKTFFFSPLIVDVREGLKRVALYFPASEIPEVPKVLYSSFGQRLTGSCKVLALKMLYLPGS